MKYTLQSLIKQNNQQFTALIRYAEASEDIVQKALSAYDPLPSNVRFIPNGSNIPTQRSLSQGYEELYLVRLDCDDTYRKSFIRQLQEVTPKPDTLALLNQHGYVYDSLNHRMAYIRRSSPPFYTWIYKTDEYFNSNRRYIRGHRKVIRYKHEILTDDGKPNFMIVVHERNTSNQKMLSRYEFEANPSAVNKILKGFI
ncbi:hypothetical protein FPL14_05935 [Cohnella cholangitidis]|uniref:Uncharacterized protein n=2 Tax=Cohnella cholangitidis TaxID=2598458 RepID=A0A7G5BV12_9BACL|nr:hypothetical protein FPL14_05935 [Cohnella cholangitidis]